MYKKEDLQKLVRVYKGSCVFRKINSFSEKPKEYDYIMHDDTNDTVFYGCTENTDEGNWISLNLIDGGVFWRKKHMLKIIIIGNL